MEQNKYCIIRHVEGVTLNPKEYILEGPEEGSPVKLFDAPETALSWLNTQTSEDLTKEGWEEQGISIEEYQ